MIRKQILEYYKKDLKKEEKKKLCLLTSLSAIDYSIAQIKLIINKTKQGF